MNKIKKIDTDINININSYINILVKELSEVLSEICEELNTNASEFKNGLTRIISRMVLYMKNSPDKIFIFPDTIPGFAVMSIKKEDIDGDVVTEKKIELDELKSITQVLSNYTKKTSCNVVTIENKNFIIAFFPSDDHEVRKSLKNLGFYFSY